MEDNMLGQKVNRRQNVREKSERKLGYQEEK
jgi:hypothetical protein